MSSVSTPPQSGDESLGQYGYKQELRRDIKRFASFAVCFSFISITTGIFSTYGTILNTGGPLGIWTWPVSVIGQLLVALVFAALAARMPIAGYSYQWMSRLTNPKIGWLIGWIAFTFLIVVTVSVDYAIASVALPALLSYTATALNEWLITAGILIIQLLLIVFSTRWTARLNNVAVGTEVIGIVVLTILLLVVGLISGGLHPDHLFSYGAISASGYFNLGTLTAVGPFFLSFLLGAYTIVGFEAAANLAEETEEAHHVVPFSIWLAVLLSGIVGMVFLIALNLASGNLKDLAASGTPVADIVTQTLGTVVGDIFLVIVTFSIFACGMVAFITATRLVWAMSRDQRFPAHTILRRVDVHTNTPLTATLLCGLLMEIVLAVFAFQSDALLNLFSASSLLPAIIYLATVIMYIVAKKKLPASKGFHLGAFEWPVIILALVWLVFELSIFRDASFAKPWLYTVIMFAIGLIYFVYLLFANPAVLSVASVSDEPQVDLIQPDVQA
ncbi:amino acid permease [Tengunoibacter tsumagoiensis]|uniref:Amino acid permease n=1 Tax=Tengunoibacter tsumagoiensis TaxID=2014871 RepID=A0A402A9L5_9CHLR|nr:amino acid permease [Tengunoibacter tsumagoiensis]GCE15852.1 amino acid permease [Tengunoibacter tsumagoiensis]